MVDIKHPKIDMSKWIYNIDDKVFYQLSILYASKHPSEDHNTFAIFVPEVYFTSTKNSDNSTYTCILNKDSKRGKFASTLAPFAFLVETPGYFDCKSLKEYRTFTEYTNKGIIYIYPGCRGRSHGAPLGIVDLKAVVRYIRYNKDILPGDTSKIITFGMSGGGAQSALMGSSGDSPLYEPYLKEIGAVKESDEVYGSMCWCPVTNLDQGNESYEWNLGVNRKNLDAETKDISDKMSETFAKYINEIHIKGEKGEILTLEKSEEGIYQSGSYYELIKSEIERSLNNFLNDVVFPYDASKANKMPFPPHMKPKHREREDKKFLESLKEAINDVGDDKEKIHKKGDMPYEMRDKIMRMNIAGDVELKGIYNNIQEYINALNQNKKWVLYDENTKALKITSVSDFVKALKPATKIVGAFDDLSKKQGENTLFGLNGSNAHFDYNLYEIVKNTSHKGDFEKDFNNVKDSVGNDIKERLLMYTPLNYLMEKYPQYKKSKVAKYWRIRSGLQQGDCSLCTEINLALACKNYEGVKSVDFEMIWDQKHTKAERKGNSDTNFIQWVEEIA